jgi:ribonucleotide monophosphatase NagD (HAD superfamily)
VRCVETASGVAAVNVGKGGAWLQAFLARKYALQPHSTGVIGDRLDTDIQFGKQVGPPQRGVPAGTCRASYDADRRARPRPRPQPLAQEGEASRELCLAYGPVQGGFRTFLPLTGVTQLRDMEPLSAEERPDVVCCSVANLAGLA